MAAAEPAATVPADKFKNWVWQLEVCNACRYCEGFCAVFPALERRRTFTMADVDYLANLCFDCRACYYACMFAPPHEFGVNIPQMMSEVRRETYARYALPTVLARALRTSWIGVGLLILAFALFFLGVVYVSGDPGRLFLAHVGAGAFYAVIPYLLMTIPALVVGIGALAVLFTYGMVGEPVTMAVVPPTPATLPVAITVGLFVVVPLLMLLVALPALVVRLRRGRPHVVPSSSKA
jgi:citrate/tricarballylate utilization protein